MKLSIHNIAILTFLFFNLSSCAQSEQKKKVKQKTHRSTSNLKEGDLIFQQTGSDFSKAIQLATGSKYSHVGIIFKQGEEWMVMEALQPVRITPLQDFIHNGIKDHYVIKRWKADSLINDSTKQIMMEIGQAMLGKNYDNTFNWSDDKIYCSELVWKIYNRTFNVAIGELQELRTFDLSHPLVKQQMEANYGDSIPLDEPIISPIAMFNSDQLVTIKESP